MTLALIAAIARDGAIGKDGGLPWGVLEGDRRWFRLLTRSRNPYRTSRILCGHLGASIPGWSADGPMNACIMGRKTWETLPTALPGRIACVLTHDAGRLAMQKRSHGAFYGDFDMALALDKQSSHTFIIGGAQVYDAALRLPKLETLYLTEVDAEYADADTWWPVSAENGAWEMGIVRMVGYAMWHRKHVSPWIEEPDRPRYRCGIWARL